MLSHPTHAPQSTESLASIHFNHPKVSSEMTSALLAFQLQTQHPSWWQELHPTVLCRNTPYSMIFWASKRTRQWPYISIQSSFNVWLPRLTTVAMATTQLKLPPNKSDEHLLAYPQQIISAKFYARIFKIKLMYLHFYKLRRTLVLCL